MTKKAVVALVAVVVVVGGGFLFLRNNQNIALTPSPQTATMANNVVPSNTQPSQATSSTQSSSTAILFANSQYASSSYLISTTSTYNAATQQALKGFQVKKKVLTDGSLQIELIALQSEYPNQTYVVKPGEKLYFVEVSSVDDSVSEDHSPADDHAILVDANGYVL